MRRSLGNLVRGLQNLQGLPSDGISIGKKCKYGPRHPRHARTFRDGMAHAYAHAHEHHCR